MAHIYEFWILHLENFSREYASRPHRKKGLCCFTGCHTMNSSWTSSPPPKTWRPFQRLCDRIFPMQQSVWPIGILARWRRHASMSSYSLLLFYLSLSLICINRPLRELFLQLSRTKFECRIKRDRGFEGNAQRHNYTICLRYWSENYFILINWIQVHSCEFSASQHISNIVGLKTFCMAFV